MHTYSVPNGSQAWRDAERALALATVRLADLALSSSCWRIAEELVEIAYKVFDGFRSRPPSVSVRNRGDGLRGR
jgi:hypothetical protein